MADSHEANPSGSVAVSPGAARRIHRRAPQAGPALLRRHSIGWLTPLVFGQPDCSPIFVLLPNLTSNAAGVSILWAGTSGV